MKSDDVLYIDDRVVYTGYVRTENREQFLTKVPLLHPADPRYTIFWSRETRRCVEGLWGKMFGGWRYMRGNLYYYGNYTLLQETDRNKVTRYIRPSIDDLEWEFSYGMAEARGFSGFVNDDQFTSLIAVREGASEAYLEEYHPSAFNSKGRVKEFVEPRVYLRQIQAKPLGRALYENETWNFGVLGSRGGGKSYYFALGELEYGLIFDGATHYNQEFLDNKITAEFCIGASMSDKSSEACTKIKASIEAKADPVQGRQFGVWGEGEDDPEYTPCPFYRHFSGSMEVPNKKNPFQYIYKKNRNGIYVPTGTRTKLNHVNYSAKKGDGAQAAAGGRYLVSEVEEWGLVENCIDVNTSNNTTTAREGVRFGVEAYLGTSGNLLKVQDAKKMFLNPLDYRLLPYPNMHGSEGEDGQVAFFLSFLLTLRQYKDKDGNTKWREAVDHVNKVRARAAKSKDPRVLRDEKMNRPCFVDEMWLSLEGNMMPIEELQRREKELMTHNMYRSLETPVKLIWDSKMPYGVDYKIDHDLEPYRDWPLDFSKRKDPRGCVVIYDMPRYVNGHIPPDLYCFIGHDPYVEEDLDRGGSIGSTYILINPRYIPHGLPGNIIVASYNDKPAGGLDEYYENQEKLLALYGNPPQGLWYEKNRGADCRAHYIHKNKIHLLAPTPQHTQGASAYERGLASYGYLVGNRIAKLQMTKTVADWLLEETELPLDGKKKNVERLPCLFLVRQMIAHNLDDNFDAFDGFRGAVLGLKDYEVRNAAPPPEIEEKRKKTFTRFMNNPKIFKNARGLSQAQGFRR